MTTPHPKKVLGHVAGVKIVGRNTFSVPLKKSQFREITNVLGHALMRLGDFHPKNSDGTALRALYNETYTVLARLCSAEGKTRIFVPALMHSLRIEDVDMVQGCLCVSFRYSADGIPNAEYHFHLHDEMAPYVDNYVDKYEKAGGTEPMRRTYDMV